MVVGGIHLESVSQLVGGGGVDTPGVCESACGMEEGDTPGVCESDCGGGVG